MRIGCLQFAPRLAQVDENLELADEILDRANPEDLDILVLPELAFTGTLEALAGSISWLEEMFG